jgi:hypothetical protein
VLFYIVLNSHMRAVPPVIHTHTHTHTHLLSRQKALFKGQKSFFSKDRSHLVVPSIENTFLPTWESCATEDTSYREHILKGQKSFDSAFRHLKRKLSLEMGEYLKRSPIWGNSYFKRLLKCWSPALCVSSWASSRMSLLFVYLHAGGAKKRGRDVGVAPYEGKKLFLQILSNSYVSRSF